MFTYVSRQKYAVEEFSLFSFHAGVREWYNVISIIHHYLYAYKGVNQHIIVFYNLQYYDSSWHLKAFVRGVFFLFRRVISTHGSTCGVKEMILID